MKTIIRLAFRLVIDQHSTHPWDRLVFEDTYQEYRIQHLVFNNKNQPSQHYWELIRSNPHAQQIPFLLSTAVENYVHQLNGEITSITDVLGIHFFKFENFRVDLVSSHISDASKHKIGITFYSPPLLLIDIIDGKYLLSEQLNPEETLPTYMLPFHHQVSIATYQKLKSTE